MSNKLINKIAILAISIFLMSHLAIAPAIPKLLEFYKNTNSNIGLASIENLVTIPAMMITIFVLVSNIFVAKIGKKNTVLIGLILIMISGLLAFLTTNFTLVLISRLLLGIGIGLYNSISISIISDYYEGDVRNSMIGYRTAFLNIGKALTTFIAGYAVLLGANYTYLVYLLVIPVLVIFYKYVPQSKQESTLIKQNVKVNSTTILTAIATFFVGISYIGATIKIPTLLTSKFGMTVATSSNVLTVLAVSGIFIGFIFGKLLKKLGNKTLLVMIALMIVGNLLFATTSNIVLFYIAALFIGASFVGTMSFVFYYISNNFNKEFINFNISIALTAGNIGVILTPLILTKIPEKLGMELLITPFYITSGIMAITFIVYYFLTKNKN